MGPRTRFAALVLSLGLVGHVVHADAKSRREAVEKATRELVAKGLITSASSAQVDVTAKFVAKPLDDQAKLAAGLCKMWAIVAWDEDTEADHDAGTDEAVASAACDVTRSGANLLGRTLGDTVQWQTWYLATKTRR